MKPLQLPGSGKRPSFTEQSTTLALVQAGLVVAAGSGREVVVADPEGPDPGDPDPEDPDTAPPEQEPPLLAPMSM